MSRRDALRAAALGAAMAMSACAPASVTPPTAPARPARVVSLDYCADQFVLGLADKDQIAAVSPDAEAPFSTMRARAAGVPQVRPSLEDVLALRPDLVVRSYGGGPGVTAALARAGVAVVEVGYEDSFDGARANTVRIATALGQSARGAERVAEMDRRLAALAAAAPHAGRPRALYYTVGGVTTGPGGVVDAMMRAAGFDNYETAPGWRPLPLERIAADPPDVVIAASFGTRADHQDFWSAARHPIARDLLATRPVAAINGALTSCSAWVLVEGVEAMRAGLPK